MKNPHLQACARLITTGIFIVSLIVQPAAARPLPAKTVKHPIIRGDSSCISRTKSALSLLKIGSPTTYKQIGEYIDVIECVQSGSVMWVWEVPRRHTVGKATREADTRWYASGLAHESCHSKQYTDYRKKHPNSTVPSAIYSGEKAERECAEYQRKTLIALKAPKSFLTHLDAEIKKQWWTAGLRNMTW